MKVKSIIMMSFTMLFFIGCEDGTDIEGCTDVSADNYISDATIDDSSCTYSAEFSGAITEDQTWKAGGDYILSAQTFVKSGVTLTIEAGTTIKAAADDGAGLAPALIIEQGAKIMAVGTAASPITFTSMKSAAELSANPRGNWGGLIILGKAPISTDGGTNFVEGVEGVPYGGSDPNDNSGILKYVRVWHGGKSIGQDNEINGITLAGVGNGTTVEHCEVAHNLDDGFEMFGGTVDLKWCSVYHVGDDSFDTDEGYQGRGQFLFVERAVDSDRCMEMDNKTGGDLNSQPRSHPKFSNMTCLGSNGDADMAKLREGTGGDHRNLVMIDGAKDGIENEDNGTEIVSQVEPTSICPGLGSSSGCDYLYISANTLFYNVTTPWVDTVADSTHNFTNQSGDPGISSSSLLPTAGGPAFQDVDNVINDGWFESVDYKGAFGTVDWLTGWSIKSQ
jgi:hypothetical protein|tara:strand:+ start:199 stop:1542 length:1344 start_codon:yes stop_codon:yes gene_type:complete